MKKPGDYKLQLDDINIRHYLALEQAEFIFPLHKNDKKNKEYAKQYEDIVVEFDKTEYSLNDLENTMKKQNKILQEKNRKLKRQLKHKENQEKKMNGKNTGYDDTERALIEMKKDYKKTQSETFIKALDMTLGIILVCYLIYKKSK